MNMDGPRPPRTRLHGQFNGNKLITLAEFGGVPDIEKMQRFGVWWSWFAPWVGSYGPSGMPAGTVARIYQSPAVFTLDEANAVPPKIVSITPGPNRQVDLIGKGPRGQTNRIFAATSVTLPIASWSAVHTSKFSGGVFTWTDSQAANYPLRFYRTRAN